MVLIKLKSNDDKVFEVEKEVGHACYCSDIHIYLEQINKLWCETSWNPPIDFLDDLKVAVMSVTIKQLLENADYGDVSIF